MLNIRSNRHGQAGVGLKVSQDQGNMISGWSLVMVQYSSGGLRFNKDN